MHKIVDNLAKRYMRDYQLSPEQAVAVATAVLNNLALGTKSKEQMAQELKGYGLSDKIAQQIASKSTNRENLTKYFEDAARSAGFLGKKVEEKTAQVQQKVAKQQAEIEKQMEEEEIKQLELMYSKAIEIMEKIEQRKIDVANVQAEIDRIKAEYEALYNKYKPKIEKLEKAGLEDPRNSRFYKALKKAEEAIGKAEEMVNEFIKKDNKSPWITKDNYPAGP